MPTAATTPPAYADERERDRHQVFRISSPQITESSSLFVSTSHPGLVYTTNDSGDTPTVYVLRSGTGSLVGRTTLAGVSPVDIEALAGGDEGSLVVADIGDNGAARDGISAYRLPQPQPGRHFVAADGVRLEYVDGPRDAEAALYDARSGRLYVVSKEFAGASVYVTAPNAFGRSKAVLRPVARAPAFATDATLLPGGERAVIRTYAGAVIYRFPSFERVRAMDLPRTEQGESIAAPASGRVVWVGTEGERSAVIAVRLPRPAPTAQPPPPSPTASTAPPSDGDAVDARDRFRGTAEIVLAGSVVGLLVVTVLLVVLLLRRRRPG